MKKNLAERYQEYFKRFSEEDKLQRFCTISNEDASAFLLDNIPLLDLPDKTLETVYAFRWWSFRKHLKKTETGWVITEFLPDVPWAGKYNTINCSTGFHIREGRWLKNSDETVKQYIDFWLDEIGNPYSYSMWLAAAIQDYLEICDDHSFLTSRLSKITDWFEKRDRLSRDFSGLYYSIDDRDGMEYSISGNGFRPTLNSYVCADAYAISSFAYQCGNQELQTKYLSIANEIKDKINHLLWTGNFYQTIPDNAGHKKTTYVNRPEIDALHDVKELVGFIPWYFDIAENGYEKAFDNLISDKVFYTQYGLTTADQSHPRYMEKHDHECLWNGPIWPFATSQVLVAAANMLRNKRNNPTTRFTKDNYYSLLKQYASSHYRRDETDKQILWIDENMDPSDGKWLSRDILQGDGWKVETGGFERGANYNHSLYCDLILSGLLGIGCTANGNVRVDPLIPDNWDHFTAENITIHGHKYTISYNKPQISILED